MRTAFVQTLTDLMRKDDRLVTITADMGFSVYEDLQQEFPDRFLNTGVTEQSSIGIATGMALSGFKVFFYAQAPFATMRCFEQIRLDVAYNNVDVKIVGVSAGFASNQLGVSHFATEDVSLMRQLPNMTVFTPGDPAESMAVTNAAYNIKGPCYIRLTKAGSPVVHKTKINFKIGKGIVLDKGADVSIFVSGSLLPNAVEVLSMLEKDSIHPSLISMPTIKPLDKDLVLSEMSKNKKIVTIEEHSIYGGLGTAVAEVLAEEGVPAKLLRLGVLDKFTSVTGSVPFLLDYNGLSVLKMTDSIKNFLKN